MKSRKTKYPFWLVTKSSLEYKMSSLSSWSIAKVFLLKYAEGDLSTYIKNLKKNNQRLD